MTGSHPDRRAALARMLSLGAWPALPGALTELDDLVGTGRGSDDSVDDAAIRGGAALAGLEFTPAERGMMLATLRRARDGFLRVREVALGEEDAPATIFRPLGAPRPVEPPTTPWRAPAPPEKVSDEDLFTRSVSELGALLRAGRVSSRHLVEVALERLERANPTLLCTVTLLAESARAAARRCDAELAAGRDRGPLHGIPWGAKDIIAAAGAPTSWGVASFRDRTIDRDAGVVERLQRAGAVLCAKLSTGELAMGDRWFGGVTRNPWDPRVGSSGSSAGPASAVAAALLPFAIGSETLGSIVSPCGRCGVTGLRPTFGRVGRGGVMALSWSMDKVGPIARSAEDCALVLEAIAGPDPRDASALDAPFAWRTAARPDPKKLRYGVPAGLLGRRAGRIVSDFLAAAGIPAKEVVEVDLPELPVWDLMTILNAEAAAAFDDFTLQGRLGELAGQDEGSWPNVFRAARLLPAVEMIRAQRTRRRLMRAMEERLAEIDVLVTPNHHRDVLGITNLTGHPTLVLPVEFRLGQPRTLSLVGRTFGEDALLAVAVAFQAGTDHHRRRPDLG
ncbi:MAG: amidase [Planctomycetota bacterium]